MLVELLPDATGPGEGQFDQIIGDSDLVGFVRDADSYQYTKLAAF